MSILSNPDVVTAIVALIVAVTAYVKVKAQETQQHVTEVEVHNVQRQNTQTLALVSKHEGQLNGGSPSSSPGMLPGSSGDVPGNMETGSSRIGNIVP